MTQLEVKCLDHGFVILRNLSGPTRRAFIKVGGINNIGAEGSSISMAHEVDFDADDRDIANVARISFDGLDSTRALEADLKLADYLMRNKHTSPFEMIEVWLEMKLPIFVARQFVRHRTVSINEVSARYTKLPAEWYIPSLHTVGHKPASMKQGRSIGEARLTDEQEELAREFLMSLDVQCQSSYKLYELYLEKGIPPELARMCLHLNHYTHWVWKQDLHNLMHFLSLRTHSHAQYEARVYAEAVYQLLKEHLPNLMELFDKYRRLPE